MVHIAKDEEDKAVKLAEEYFSKEEIEVNCTELDKIRNMRGRCLIVTENHLMRGVDYRVGEQEAYDRTDGIDLFLGLPFGYSCDFEQAAARVGRHNDPCTRYISCDNPGVDKVKEAELQLDLSSA